MRLCTLSYTRDSSFDKEISEWSDTCKSHLTTTITTPADVPLTQTYNELSCQTLIVSCDKLAATQSSCSSAFTEATDLYNCRCASDVLSLASECQIDGALECLRTTPDPRTLWAVRFCSMTPTIPGGIDPVATDPGTTDPGTPTGPPLSSTPVSCLTLPAIECLVADQ